MGHTCNPVLGKLKQEESYESEDNLGYRVPDQYNLQHEAKKQRKRFTTRQTKKMLDMHDGASLYSHHQGS